MSQDDLKFRTYGLNSDTFELIVLGGFLGEGVGVVEGIFGNKSAERVLLYLEQYGEGYGRAIAATFETVSVSMALAQLKRFETAGLLVSQRKGKTLVFSWNPRSIFVADVRALLRKALDALPENERKRYFSRRQRPRRSGKTA